jgi:2-polyprenyl-3-methyl-5-hydroxy-6-metoxy-1,4-benzoquinol methylase
MACDDSIGRELPLELSERIQREASENDAIYRSRPIDTLDMSGMHFGHTEIVNRALARLPNLKGARVLDVGIGEGHSSVLMTRAGAHVTGIDVSSAALDRAAELAKRNGVKIDFRQMPGEDLLFEDSSYDAILCMSAYHHMDLQRATREFARVLRPGGRLVMNEPLATNPPAWLYRRVGRLFAREATSKETPLRVGDLKFLRQHFRQVEWQGMFFLSVCLFGLDRIWNNSNPVVHSLTASAFRWVCPLDSMVMKIPGLQRIAWRIAIVAERKLLCVILSLRRRSVPFSSPIYAVDWVTLEHQEGLGCLESG